MSVVPQKCIGLSEAAIETGDADDLIPGIDRKCEGTLIAADGTKVSDAVASSQSGVHNLIASKGGAARSIADFVHGLRKTKRASQRS